MNQTQTTPQTKDPNTALIIELLAGFFGFLGIGYFYAGRTSSGLLRLLGYWGFLVVLIFLTITITSLMSPNNAGGGLLIGGAMICLVPLSILGIPIWSAITLKNSLKRQQGI